MNSNEQTIEYDDTSIKKYPYNKYYDYKDLNHVSKRVFDDKIHSQTIDTHTLRQKAKQSKQKQKRPSKKSVNTSKTMSSSMLKYRPKPINMSITLDNYKEFNKNQIAEELHQYTKLCLNLRKQNYSLKHQLEETKLANKENLVQMQKKINKINEKSLEKRQKQLMLQESKIKQSKDQKKNRSSLVNTNKPKQNARQGQFKRFFLHFVDSFGRVDQKLQRKMLNQKTLEHKVLIGQKILKEGCQFLKQKKYKFNCIFD